MTIDARVTPDEVTSSEGDALAEANNPATGEVRLHELVAGPDRDAATVALGRLLRERLRTGLADVLTSATDPAAQAAAALGILSEALRLLPARVAVMASDQVSAALALAGWNETDSLIQIILDAILASRGPEVETLARQIAVDWDGPLGQLMDAAETLHRSIQQTS